MKKFLYLAALVVALLVPRVTSAQTQVQVKAVALAGHDATKGYPLKWVKLATTDSTTVAIPAWAPATSVVAAQDTTEWVKLSDMSPFAPAAATGINLLDAVIDHQSGASADSVGYIVQWTADPRTIAGTTSNFTTATQTVALPTGGSTSSIANILSTNTSAGTAFRIVAYNLKVASGVTRIFAIRLVQRAIKA